MGKLRKAVGPLAVVGLLVLAGGLVAPVLLLLGLERVSGTSGSLLLNLEGVLTALLAWFVFRENFDRRIALGMQITYPMLAEVKHLYAEEYAQAEALVSAINVHSGVQLPQDEAVGLALHLVNVGFATGDLSYTYKMTGVIQQMVRVIEERFDVTLDSGGVNVGRFITHLRYLFVRIHQHKQLDAEPSLVGAAIRESFPAATDCAVRLAGLLELRMGAALTPDEVSYLALHVARVTTPDR